MLLRKYILPVIIWIIYRAFWVTWKIRIHEPEALKYSLHNKEPFILGHFHGDEIVLLSLIGYYRIATISSQSKDGEIMNTLVHLVGGKTSRGSSTRGAVQALKGLIRLMKEQHRNCSFAVDGPKGPLHKVKPGIFETSRLMKAPIFVSGIYCNNAFHFPKSWNKTYLPKPFAKIEIVWSGPIGPISKDMDPRSQELAESAEKALFQAQKMAQELFAQR
ncbi:MAG: DUF374 domain-containing protein [Deltaproteobacteria bacterium]|nr:DUF374 domain-containing protein [Deltaproteobacteria bacterium]